METERKKIVDKSAASAVNVRFFYADGIALNGTIFQKKTLHRLSEWKIGEDYSRCKTLSNITKYLFIYLFSQMISSLIELRANP